MKSIRRIKTNIRDLLERNDLKTIIELARNNPRIVSVLISMSYDKDSLLTWRAIEAIGPVVAEISKNSPEQGADIVRRLLWSITEESGGIGWAAIEMLAEIIVNYPERYKNLVPLLMEFYDEEIFRDGVLYAIGRIGERMPELFDDPDKIEDIISDGLTSDDPQIRGLALIACKRLADTLHGIGQEQIRRLKGDESTFTVYEKGRLINRKINEVLHN
ncbi:MAG: hypothetical protein GXO97_08975 [Nitrospirae bacterium]|nr:hypothetical protein [Nitrospirota bacterium]